MRLWPFSRRATKVAATHPSAPSSEVLTFLGGTPSGSGVTVTATTALQSMAVLACVRLLSETIASLPLHTYRRLPKGKERATSLPLYPVLHNLANEEMTSFDWREAQMANLLLRGNAFSYIDWSQRGTVRGLWPLRSDQVTVERKADGMLWYRWQPQSAPAIEFPRWQILHTHFLSLDGVMGLSPIGLARESIGLGIAAEGFGARFFGNDTTTGVVLEHPKTLSDVAQKRLVAQWEAQHKGFTRAHKVAVLEEGMKASRIGIPPEDAQFLETRKFQVTEIARLYRVPPHMIADLDRATFSNIEHQGIDFVVHSLRPWLVRLEQAMARDLLSEAERRTYYFEFLVDGLLRGDTKSRYDAYAVGRQWGWLSADEVRERENMNPLPDGKGEEYLNPLNMIPAGVTNPALVNVQPASPSPDPEPQAMRSGAEALLPVIVDAAGRVLRRESVDVLRAFDRAEERGDAQGLADWINAFVPEHREFVALQFRPACEAAATLGLEAPASEEGAADEIAKRWVQEMMKTFTTDSGATPAAELRAAYQGAVAPGWLREWFEPRREAA